MKNTILLVVDVQEALVQGHPYKEKEFLNNIKILIDTYRANEVEVI